MVLQISIWILRSNSPSDVIGELEQKIRFIFLNEFFALWPNFI